MFGRIKKLVIGFLGLFIKGIEVSNPKALIEAERIALQKAVAQWNTNLAKQAGFIARLSEQIKREEKEIESLTVKVTAHLRVGNKDAARNYVLALDEVKREMGENRNQIEEAQKLYTDLLKQRDVYVREARERIENIMRKLSRVEIAEAQATLAEIASSTSFDIASSGATMERIEEGLDERFAKASGKVKVALDSQQMTDVNMKEVERDALADKMLTEFAAAQGIEVPASISAAEKEAPQKTVGPKEASKQ